MGVIKNIVEGWGNLLLQRENVLSELRMKICNGCDYISTKDNIRPDVHCTKCGCTLAAKTRSLESECPIGLWKAVKLESSDAEKKIYNKEDPDSGNNESPE